MQVFKISSYFSKVLSCPLYLMSFSTYESEMQPLLQLAHRQAWQKQFVCFCDIC